MTYFINLPHNTNLYGKKILLKNVNGINFQRKTDFIKFICKNYCDCSNQNKKNIIFILLIIILILSIIILKNNNYYNIMTTLVDDS